jgi:pyridoxal phosphate enzyme (YggS family)
MGKTRTDFADAGLHPFWNPPIIPTMEISHLPGRLLDVQARVARAANEVGRDPDEVTLVAVTKTWPAEVVVAAYEAGLRHFGENRPEELAPKRQAVEAVLGSDAGIVWHMIGAVQSRKTDLVAESADVFHALDRLKIARRLSGRLAELDAMLPTMLEVNVSGEASKAGFDCRQWEVDSVQREKLVEVAASVIALPGLRPCGLMTMAPWEAPPDEVREVFRRTRKLAEWLAEAVPQCDWSNLSMGMTDDFELAIAEGATHIRVGRALFGERG